MSNNTPDIPSPTELASIADDLEKQTENVDQLEFLVTILDKLTELDPKSNETASNFKWKLEFHPSDLRFLSEAFSTLADGLEYHDMESDGVLESVEHIREMLSLKATKAVGRA
jgi:hypothetical protein